MRIRNIFFIFMCFTLVFCASRKDKVEEKSEKDPQYLYNLGLYHLNSGNLDEALKQLEKVLSLNPQHYLALNALGLTNFMKGNFNGAAECFKKCLGINPKFTEAHNNLGTAYLEMGFIDKAIEEYQLVLQDKRYSSKELPYFNLAKLNFNLGKLNEAFEYVQKALSENNRFGAAYNLKGLILESLGNMLEAIKSYEQAVKIVPKDINFSFNFAVALFKNGEHTRAKQIFEKLLSGVDDAEMMTKIKQYLKLIER